MEITTSKATPWNKGKLVGQKLPLKLKEIWAIRVRLPYLDRHIWTPGLCQATVLSNAKQASY